MARSHFIFSTPPSRGPFMWSLPTEEPYSTADIIHSALRIARVIEALPGYAPGRHVALRMPASAECAASILGCWFARAVPASINGTALAAETEHCTKMVDPMAILHLPSTPYPADIVPDCKRIDATSLLERLSEDAPLPGDFDIDGELDAIILFTSGSTGLPKGVRISHTGLAHSLRGLESAIAPKSETFLLQVPMHHVFGVVTFLLAYTTGSRVVSLQDFRADALLDAIGHFKVSIGFGPPEMFLALAHHPRLDQYDIRSFSRLLLGGSPCRKPQILEIESRLNLSTIFLSFGMTETTGGVSLAPFRDSFDQESIHAGRPVSTIEVAAFSEGRQLQPGNVGELCFRGPHLMRGYVGDDDLPANAWIASGDLGYVDSSELVHVTGRIKEIIIKAGENISIAEIENTLLAAPGVKEVCVVGIPDARLGENIAAMVVPMDTNINKRALQTFCLGKILKSHIPTQVRFVETLPKLSIGKVDRAEVKRIFANS